MKSKAARLIERLDSNLNENLFKDYSARQIEDMLGFEGGYENLLWNGGLSSYEEDDAVQVEILVSSEDEDGKYGAIYVFLKSFRGSVEYDRYDLDFTKAKDLAEKIISVIQKNEMRDNPFKKMIALLKKNKFESDE